MSTELERELDNFLFFDGPLPDLAQGVTEVPMPKGFYICMECKRVTSYWKPGMVCQSCEAKGERQMEQERGN